MKTALLAAALLVWAVPSVSARCMQLELKAQVLTPSVEVTGDGGGIVVATTGTGRDDKGELPATLASWKLRVGKTLGDAGADRGAEQARDRHGREVITDARRRRGPRRHR